MWVILQGNTTAHCVRAMLQHPLVPAHLLLPLYPSSYSYFWLCPVAAASATTIKSRDECEADLPCHASHLYEYEFVPLNDMFK